jgi:hypothetical protein
MFCTIYTQCPDFLYAELLLLLNKNEHAHKTVKMKGCNVCRKLVELE